MNMKKTLFFSFLLISNLTFAQKVSFEIINTKTQRDNIGAIILHVKVSNKSRQDITILKPSTDFNQKWRYYNAEIECSMLPLWDAGNINNIKRIAYCDSDLLVIPAKSNTEIIINGRHNADMLCCNSKTFQVKLSYDASELIKESTTQNLNADELKIVKMLTPIKIESKKTQIVIN